jgi:hypothetical protein
VRLEASGRPAQIQELNDESRGGRRYLSNGFSRQLLTDFPLSTAGARCRRCTLVVRIAASLKASTPLSETHSGTRDGLGVAGLGGSQLRRGLG